MPEISPDVPDGAPTGRRSSSWRFFEARIAPPREPKLTGPLPAELLPFVWSVSGRHQFWLICLSLLTAVLDAVPLEIQRRLVNAAVREGDLRSIGLLASSFIFVALVQGFIKMLVNVYRSWVSETAVFDLRALISATGHGSAGALDRSQDDQGTEISMLIAESDAIGGFVGDAISQPVLQIGILVSVGGYLTYLQPLMVLIMLAIFLPQAIFIPLIQKAINRRAQARITTLRATSGSVLGEADGPEKLKLQDALFRRVFSHNMGIFELKFILNFLMNFMHQMGVALVLAVGGWLVVTGQTEIGTVVAFVAGLSTVRAPWNDLVSWFQSYWLTKAKYVLIEKTLNGERKPAPLPA